MALGRYDDSIPQEGSKLIKLLSESFIKPKPELLPDDHVSKGQPHYLGPIDLAMLSLDHMQRGLLFQYSKPKELDVPSFLDRLKLSLSLSLLHFYPLAGRLATDKYPDEHASWIYVDCTKGPGARLLHASVDLTVSDILSSTDVHPIVRSFFDLGEKAVNYDGHTRPLLSIQVTELLDGMCIGFTMSHTVGDGTSLWHFVSSFSEVFLKLSAQELNHDDINFNSITISNKPNDLVIAGSAKSDAYAPEFGLGRAAASVPAGYANKVDGKVTATPGRDGGGSVELEVSLNPTTMNALELDDEFMSFVSTSTAD